MPSRNQMVRRGRGSGNPVTKYIKYAGAIGREGIKAYGTYRKYVPKSRVEAGPVSQGAVLTSIYNSKRVFSKKKTPRRTVKRAKRKQNLWLQQWSKLQNPQQALGSGGTLNTTDGVNLLQAWTSFDMANVSDIDEIFSSQLPTTVSPAAARDYRMALRRFNLNVQIVNTGTNAVELEIYTVVPRKDIASTEIGAGTGGNAVSSWLQTIAGTFGIGGSDVIPAPGNPTAIFDTNSPGFTPFMNTRFCRAFKILDVRRIQLSAGQIHSSSIKLKRPRFLAQEAFMNLSYKAGLTTTMLVRQRGINAGAVGVPYPATKVNFDWQLTSNSKITQIANSSMANILTT